MHRDCFNLQAADSCACRYRLPEGRRALRERARSILAWTGVVLAMALVFVSPLPVGCQYQQHWPVMAGFALLLGAVALAAHALDENARQRVDPVLIALGCLGALFVVQLIPLPAGLVRLISPARLHLACEAAEAAGESPPGWLPLTTCLKCTRDALLLLFAYISIFYASARLLASGGRWKFVLGVAVAGASVLALYGFIQVLSDWGARLTATYTNPNRFAALMAITGACAIGMFVAERQRGALGPPPRVWLVAAIVLECALVLTLSRLGIASALVAGLLTIAVFTKGRRALWVVLAGTLLILAANAALAANPVLARYSIFFESEVLGRGRFQCWRMAAPLALDFPILGSGAGTFRHAFPIYQEPSLSGWWKCAHNDYLNLVCDAGILGLAALVAAVVLVMRRIVSLRSSRNPSTRGIAVAAFLALSFVLFHSTGDFPAQQPANALVLFMVCGIAYGRVLRREEKQEDFSPVRARWTLPVTCATGLGLCVICLPLLGRLWAAGSLRVRASALALEPGKETDRGSLQRRAELFERAARLDGRDAEARYEAARTRVHLMARGTCPDEEMAAAAAEKLLAEGRAASPLDPRAYYLAAVLGMRHGRFEHPDRLMRFASKLAPAWPEVARHVGSYFLLRWHRAGREDEELFEGMAKSLSLAARSGEARGKTVVLVLDYGLSPRQIDAALSPSGEVNLALAHALARRGQHRRACGRYERAIASGELQPTSRVHVSYARSLLASGNTTTALAQFDEALQAAAKRTLGEVVRALASLRANPDRAVALADYWPSASERFGNDPAFLLALARAELAAGRDEEGFEHLLDYARKAGDGSAFAELTRLTFSRGELELAASFAEQVSRLEPGKASHHILRARVLARLGELDGAAVSLERALSLEPRNLSAARELAGTQVKVGRYDRAISVWQRFLDAGGQVAPAREGLADIYIRLRDHKRAKEELSKALEANPGNERLRKRLQDSIQ